MRRIGRVVAGLAVLGVLAGCTPVPYLESPDLEKSDRQTPTRPLPRTEKLAAGWRIPELVAAIIDDASPDRLIARHYDPATGQYATYLIDRSSGAVRWRRPDVSNCFLETADRVWCLQDVTGADRSAVMVIDGNRVTRLRGGPVTAARTAMARNRGDVDRPPTITTVRNDTGTYAGPARHSVLVRTRASNETVAYFRPAVDDNRYVASGTSFRGGFAVSIIGPAGPDHVDLFDEQGRHLRRVDGVRVGGIGIGDCELPIATEGFGTGAAHSVLLDPRSGERLYTVGSGPVYCGPDFLIDGNRFVEAKNGAVVDLPIPAPSETSTYRFAANAAHIVAVSESLVRVFDRATGDVTNASVEPGRGAQPEHADATSIVVSGVDGLESLSLL